MSVGDDRALRDLLHAVDALPLPPIDIAHTTRRARRRRATTLVATGVASAFTVVAVFAGGVVAGSSWLMVGATTAGAGLQGDPAAPQDSTSQTEAQQDTGALFSGDGCTAVHAYDTPSGGVAAAPTSSSALSANVDAAAEEVSGRLILGTPTARADEVVIVLYDRANDVAAVSNARLAETADGTATYTGALDRCTDAEIVRAAAVVRTDHGVEVTPLTAVD